MYVRTRFFKSVVNENDFECHDTYDIESEMKKRVRKLSINYKPAKIYIDSMIDLTSEDLLQLKRVQISRDTCLC